MWKKAFSNPGRLGTGNQVNTSVQPLPPQTRAMWGMRQQLGTGWGPTPTLGIWCGGVRLKLTLQLRHHYSTLDSWDGNVKQKAKYPRNHPFRRLGELPWARLFTEISTRISDWSPEGRSGLWGTAQPPGFGTHLPRNGATHHMAYFL